MKKTLLSIALVFFFGMLASAQSLKTRDGNIYFNPNKDQNNKEYAALSKEATAILNTTNGEVALLVPMKTFRFNNALLEEHFNENYLHTNKYPNATYKGKLIGYSPSMLTKDGDYKISSEGTVEMHGVKRNFKSPVVLSVRGKLVTFKCNFDLKAADYNIDIPALVKPKLKESTPLNVSIVFKK